MKGFATAKDYYDTLPACSVECGDIWHGLPSHGFFGRNPVVGLIITPSCDLARKKTETVTYIPVVPIPRFFCSVSALPEVKKRFAGLAMSAGFEDLLFGCGPYSPPGRDVIEKYSAAVRAASERSLSDKKLVAIKSLESGLNIFRCCAGCESTPTYSELSTFLAQDGTKYAGR